MKAAQLALHASALYIFYQGFHYILYKHITIINQAYGSHFQYLTIIGLAVATLAQSFGALSVLTGSEFLSSIHRRVNVVAAPLELLITILYWTIKSIDPNLLQDKRFGIVPSPWLDIRLHFYPAVFEVVDVLFFADPWKTSVVGAFGMFGTFACAYWVWIHHTFEHNGFFPYPLMELVSVPQRVVIFTASTVLVTISFKLLKTVQRLIKT